MSEQREIAVLERLTEALDTLGIPYAIGGSIASSLYVTVRFTRDADVALYPFPAVADRFCEMLKDEFYVSEEAMQQALSCCGTIRANLSLLLSRKIIITSVATMASTHHSPSNTRLKKKSAWGQWG